MVSSDCTQFSKSVNCYSSSSSSFSLLLFFSSFSASLWIAPKFTSSVSKSKQNNKKQKGVSSYHHQLTHLFGRTCFQVNLIEPTPRREKEKVNQRAYLGRKFNQSRAQRSIKEWSNQLTLSGQATIRSKSIIFLISIKVKINGFI